MTRHLGSVSLIISLSLIVSSSFATSTPPQDVPAKDRRSQTAAQRQQKEGQPAPEVFRHWQSLTATNAEPVTATWDKRNGTPQNIVGRLSRPAGGSTEVGARSFLKENAGLFRMGSQTDDLVLDRNHNSPIGQHITFAQHYRGVPVYGAQIAVHFNRSGEIITVNNSYQPDVELQSVDPQVSRGNAMSRAQAFVKGGATSRARGELVIVDFNDSFVLSWHIVFPTEGPTWEIFVNAKTGELLGQPRDINRYVNGTGQVFIVNAIVATGDK